MRYAFWLVCVLLATSNAVSLGRACVLSKTRWRPSVGTLHSVSVWYEPVAQEERLPMAKKLFNFSRSDQIQVLNGITKSFSRVVLTKTLDIDLREVATYFTELITQFAEQKRQKNKMCTCVFKTKDARKTVVAEIQLCRAKNQEIAGHVVLFGRLKEPPQAIVNLIEAATIDDSLVGVCVGKALALCGAVCAWMKLGKPLLKKMQKATSFREIATQTDSGVEKNDDEKTDVEREAESDLDCKGVGAQSYEGYSYPEIPRRHHSAQRDEQDLRLAKPSEKKDAETQVDFAGCDLGYRGDVMLRRKVAQGFGFEFKPELTIESLYFELMRSIGEDYEDKLRCYGQILFHRLQRDPRECKKNLALYEYQTCILDDASIYFVNKDGGARVFVHKEGSKRLNFDYLRADIAARKMPCKTVIVCHVVSDSGGFRDCDSIFQSVFQKNGYEDANAHGFIPCLAIYNEYKSFPEKQTYISWLFFEPGFKRKSKKQSGNSNFIVGEIAEFVRYILFWITNGKKYETHERVLNS